MQPAIAKGCTPLVQGFRFRVLSIGQRFLNFFNHTPSSISHCYSCLT